MFPCHKGPNQKFTYIQKTKQLQSKSTHKCVDVDKRNLPNSVVQRKCNPKSKTQKWVRRKQQWQSLDNKQCLDIEGGIYENGRLIRYSCHKGPNQRFFS
jgi:hypothetical protein